MCQFTVNVSVVEWLTVPAVAVTVTVYVPAGVPVTELPCGTLLPPPPQPLSITKKTSSDTNGHPRLRSTNDLPAMRVIGNSRNPARTPNIPGGKGIPCRESFVEARERAVVLIVTVAVEIALGVNMLGETEQVAWAGAPLQVSATG